MQNKDARRFNVGLNKDDHPTELQPGEYTDALNMRVASSTDQQGVGIFESLQGEVELAINVSATYYGGAIGGQFIYEGYEEVVIGNQVWMKYNLNIPYPGSLIYDNDSAQAIVYGRLYNHDHVKDSFLIPAGWRVPTEADVDELLAFLGGAMIAGGKLKEYDVTHWQSPNAGATNEFGFQMLPGGMFDTAFRLLEQMGAFWMLDEVAPVAPVLIDPAVIGTDIGSDSVIISWEPSEGADGYIITVSTDPSMDPPLPGLDGLDVGDVTEVTIPGLDPSTPYYVEVTPYNDAGEGEPSDVLEVTTRCELVPIGGQVWMCLNYEANYPGSLVYNDDEGNRIPYGGLYTQDMVLEEGFAPPGWKVPSVADWMQLINFVGSLADAGGILKETGVVYWLTPNTDAVDTYDFGMRSTGSYSIYIPDCEGMCYHSIGSVALLWATDGFVRFDYDTGEINVYSYIVPGTYYGVRLLKSGIYLTAPIATAATLIGNDRFTANWDAANGALGYYIDISTDPAFGSFVPGYEDLDVGNVTTYVITGLDPDQTYYYRVRAYDVTVTSSNSNVITVTTPKALLVGTKGTGLGVAHLQIETNGTTIVSLNGTAKFYSDQAGTLDESTTWQPSAGAIRRRYIRCPSGTADLMFSDLNGLIKFGDPATTNSAYAGWWYNPSLHSSSNVPSLDTTNWNFPNCTHIAIFANLDVTFVHAITDFSANLVDFLTFIGSVSGAVSDIPATCKIFSVSTNTISGNVSQLPAEITAVRIGVGNTITGDIAGLPFTALYHIDIQGSNTIYGDIADIPAPVTLFYVEGLNTIDGDIADFKSGMLNVSIGGNNTVTGDIADIVSTITAITIAGANTIYGDLVDLPGTLVSVSITGDNVIDGDIADLPAGTLTSLTLLGYTTIYGDIANIPVSVRFFYIGGTNTITGDLANLHPLITTLNVAGNNTIYGLIDNLPAGLLSITLSGLNTVSGDVGNMPTSIYYFYLMGNNSVADYSGKSWLQSGYFYLHYPTAMGGMSSAEVDQLLIDMDTDCPFSINYRRSIVIMGTNAAPTATSAAARASLIAKGVSLDTN